MNGGFDQYFFNSSGDLDAPEGLGDIGALETELILKGALAAFGKDGYTSNRAERQIRLDAIDRSRFDAWIADSLITRMKSMPWRSS